MPVCVPIICYLIALTNTFVNLSPSNSYHCTGCILFDLSFKLCNPLSKPVGKYNLLRCERASCEQMNRDNILQIVKVLHACNRHT